MTFEEHYSDAVERGLPDTATNRTYAQAFWDTALCEASAGCLDRGKIRDGRECLDAISKLHTWAREVPA